VFAHTCRASRKDLREAVVGARKALPGWSGATAYLRGQVLYRIAEMMEGKRAELVEGVRIVGAGPKTKGKAQSIAISPKQGEAEVTAAIDRMVAFAGWADKYAQVLGCNNAVAGPYYNFTVPEPTGVIAVVAPDAVPLLGLISLIAPAICAGNTVIALASEANPIPGAVLGEVIATSDVPGGVVNILTGQREELVPIISGHRDIDAVHAAGLGEAHTKVLREGAAENIKRVRIHDEVDWFDAAACQSPWWIEPLVEMKTMWHPSAV
jgi:acyl-CoA reductase-like NAD-dependent aldehyde dehydrogenase